MQRSKGTLSVSRSVTDEGKQSGEEEADIEVGYIELALPCRVFDIDYKITAEERFQPSQEFFLRLVYAIPGADRDQVASFFGYNQREADFVISSAANAGYVYEIDGRLSLTSAGKDLFVSSSDDPRVFTVTSKSSRVSFDLLSLAPARRDPHIVRSLPEIPHAEDARPGQASKSIRHEKLKLHFNELGLARDRDGGQKSSLYSVDSVVPAEYFVETVPLYLRAQPKTPSMVTADLSQWRPDHEITDRLEVERQVSEFVSTTKVVSRSGEADEAFDLLSEVFPGYLDKYMTRHGLNVPKFWKDSCTRIHSFRENRKTVPIAGPLFAKRNVKQISDVINYGLRGEQQTSYQKGYVWIAPQVPTWGASSVASQVNELFKESIREKFRGQEGTGSEDEYDGPTSFCIYPGDFPQHLRYIFDRVQKSASSSIPKELEVLLIPGILTFAAVHSPLFANYGFPTPIGLLSFDEEAVLATQQLLKDRLSASINEEIRELIEP